MKLLRLLTVLASATAVLAAATVAELAADPAAPDFAERLAGFDDDELNAGLTELAADDSRSEGQRLELLLPFARHAAGVRVLAGLDSDLAVLALSRGLPDNLPELLAAYAGSSDSAGDHIAAAVLFNADAARPLLEGIVAGGGASAPVAAALLYDVFTVLEIPALIEALSIEGRPRVVAAVALRQAEQAAYQPLLEAVRESNTGAAAYAPLIFAAGGQSAVTFLDSYLESPTLEVRRLAITVLSRLTGKDYSYMMDYEPDAHDYEREGLPVPPELRED
jgi:hypothetical protein